MTTKDTVMDRSATVDGPENEPHEAINAARETIRAATVQVGDAVDTVKATIPDVARA